MVSRHGFPETILSDRGSQYQNQLLDLLYEKGAVAKVLTPAYRPQMNGLTERTNGTIKRMLNKYCNENQQDWDDFLDSVLPYRVSDEFEEHTFWYAVRAGGSTAVGYHTAAPGSGGGLGVQNWCTTCKVGTRGQRPT